MCVDCVKERFPDRVSVCLDSGAYIMNFKVCSNCSRREPLKVEEKSSIEEDGVETITYLHKCSNCDHIICKHSYTFEVVDEFQEHSMQCLLCGRAEDSQSVIPSDPRQCNGFM